MPRDYYPVLAHATSALDPNTAEARRAVYDRARLALMDAGLPPRETSEERAALEQAIRRIEAEARPAGVPRPPPQPPSPERAARRSAAAAAAAAAAAKDAQRPQPNMPALARAIAIALAVTALVILAVIFWPWGRAPDRGEAPKLAVAPAADTTAGRAGNDSNSSFIYKRQLVYYRTVHPAGTVVIAKSQNFLYLVRPNVTALRYTVAVGRECANAAGLLLVSGKEERPAQPVTTTQQASPRLAAAGDADSRSGARSLTLGDTGHRIYGTSPPVTAGDECIALANEDIADLYDRVSVGTRVVIN